MNTFTHRRRSTLQGDSSAAVRARRLAQAHLHTQLVGAGDRTSNLPVTSQPAVPPERDAVPCGLWSSYPLMISLHSARTKWSRSGVRMAREFFCPVRPSPSTTSEHWFMLMVPWGRVLGWGDTTGRLQSTSNQTQTHNPRRSRGRTAEHISTNYLGIGEPEQGDDDARMSLIKSSLKLFQNRVCV